MAKAKVNISANVNGNGADRTPVRIVALLETVLSFKANSPKHSAALAELVQMFEPLVQRMAVQYWQPVVGAEIEDLEQVARAGVLEAQASFDRAKGAFPTHVSWCIRHALAAYTASLGNPVRLPTKLTYRLAKLRRIAVQLSHRLQRQPTAAELSTAIGLSEVAIRDMLIYDEGPLALDAPHFRTKNERYARREAWIEAYPTAEPSPEEALIAKEESGCGKRR